MFGIAIAIEAIFFLMQAFQSDSVATILFMYVYTTLFIQIPAILFLIILSLSTFFTKDVSLSYFKIEYYLLLASLTPFIIDWFMYTIVPYLK
jgi:hypothetical protein